MPTVEKCESSDSSASVELDFKPTNPCITISSSDSEGEEEKSEASETFQVEEIVGIKFMKNERYFKVHWQGYDHDADTWEPESNLRDNPNIAQLIESYIEEYGDVKPKVIKKHIKEGRKKPQYEEESLSEEEDWFGIKPDDHDREKRNLYVADRIPSYTEKILSEFDPGVRVLRNHLRTSYGDSPNSRLKSETPSSVSSSQHNISTNSGRRNKRTRSPSTASQSASRDVSDKDSVKLVRRRFVSQPKVKLTDTLNDIFTCDDNGSGKSHDNTPDTEGAPAPTKIKPKKRGRKPKKKANDGEFVITIDESSKSATEAPSVMEVTVNNEVKSPVRSGESASDRPPKMPNAENHDMKVERRGRKPKRDTERMSEDLLVKRFESNKEIKKRRMPDEKFLEMEKNTTDVFQIKRSSAVGIMNLACRRTALESEKSQKAPPLIPSDMPSEQREFIEQLITGKLMPEQKKSDTNVTTPKEPKAGELSSSMPIASSLAKSSKTAGGMEKLSSSSTKPSSYTPFTSSSLYKPRPFKISRMSGHPPGIMPSRADNGISSASGEATRPSEPSSSMHKVSKTHSSDTIIDSLIPVPQKQPFTSQLNSTSGISSNSSSKAGISGAASPSGLTASFGNNNLDGVPKRDSIEKMHRAQPLNLPMESRPLVKSFEQLVADRLAQMKLMSEHLTQSEFDNAVMEANVEKVRAALAIDGVKPDLNAVSADGGTLLHKVCERKCESNHAYCDIIELLVRNGARMDMREPRDGGIPLHLAIISGRLCHVRKLLALRSPVNLADYADRTPLITAIERARDDEYVNALLKAGATFQAAFRQKNIDKRALYAHQKQLQNVFDRAISAIFTNVKGKTISSIFVNPLHDGRELEHSFTVRDLAMPGPSQAYCVLICLCNMSGEKFDGRMHGYTPVLNVYMNNKQCVPLTKFVYLTTLKNNENSLTVELDAGLVMTLANAGLTSGRLGAVIKLGGDRPSEFTCANLRLLTQVYQLSFQRQAPGSAGSSAMKVKFSSDFGGHHHQLVGFQS